MKLRNIISALFNKTAPEPETTLQGLAAAIRKDMRHAVCHIAGKRPDLVTAENNFALYMAASHGRVEIGKFLHEKGAAITLDVVAAAYFHHHRKFISWLEEKDADLHAGSQLADRWSDWQEKLRR